MYEINIVLFNKWVSYISFCVKLFVNFYKIVVEGIKRCSDKSENICMKIVN